MRAPTDTQALDFSLQKLVFLPAIGAKVQSGAVRLAVIPCNPQPVIDLAAMEAAGLAPDSLELTEVVRSAYRQGLLGARAAPIQVGHAFELLQALPLEKYARLGTGLVRRIGITRYNQVTERQLLASGHASTVDFAEYWATALPHIPADANPWCWLIQFEYKG